jgi:c-di-GMP-binding flagellar brake protein YcgR
MNFITKIFKRKKRKEQRFIVDDHDLIIYDSNAPEEKEIVDLSMGGLAFVYVDNKKRLDKTFELEIKIGDSLRLGKIRVETVSDTRISEITIKTKIFRRLSARFLNLDPIQEYDLKSILKEYGKKV